MPNAAKGPKTGEIIIPHDGIVQPVSAARNALIQGSIAKLRDHGYYERYAVHVEPAALRELTSHVGPSWVDIQLADAHYGACDALNLTIDEIAGLGQGAGQRVRETSIVLAGPAAPEKPFDVWASLSPLHRSWKRIYRGGSVQITKLEERELLMDFKGFSLNKYHYFRHANVAAIKSAHEAVGVRVKAARIARYDAATHEITIHLAWS